MTLYKAATGQLPYSQPGDDDDAPKEERWPQLVEAPMPLEARVPHEVADVIMDSLAFHAG